VAFRFIKANSIAVGTFNIYIIQPKWLAEIGLMKKGVKVKLATDFNRPGFRYVADELPIHWQIFPDRIMLESDDAAIDCGTMMAEILDKLPWTPLIAIGANVEFSGKTAELHRLPKSCSLPICGEVDGFEIRQRSAHLSHQRGDQNFNVQVSDTIQQAELAINVHTELKDKPQQELNRIAQDACRNFLSHRNDAVALAQKLFNVEISYDRNSD
jgi:hypothetical protein